MEEGMSDEAARLSRTFAALADPTRRAILERLVDGEATLGELAGPFAMSLQGVSRHLQVLEQAGLVQRSRVAQQRPARLVSLPLEEAAAWLTRRARPEQPPPARGPEHGRKRKGKKG
jgi:DNA-binding transcriptional ArsR family regulator